MKDKPPPDGGTQLRRAHVLKTVEPHFSAVLQRKKTVELRRNDRDFAVGDYLLLWRYPPKASALARNVDLEDAAFGDCAWLLRQVTNLVPAECSFGALNPGFVALSLGEPSSAVYPTVEQLLESAARRLGVSSSGAVLRYLPLELHFFAPRRGADSFRR